MFESADAAAGEETEKRVRALTEKAARSKLIARQRLGDLTQKHRHVSLELRHLELRGYRAGEKRGRGDDAAPAPLASEPADATATDGGDGGGKAADATPMDTKEEGDAPRKRTRHAGDSERSEGGEAGSRGRADGEAGSREHKERNRPSPRVQLDEGSRQRSRKMFGLLRTTLAKARDESSGSSLQRQKLEQVESKLRTDREKERELQRDRLASKAEVATRRRQSIRASRDGVDERLLRLTADAHELALARFLRTESSPPIYFAPKTHNAATSAKLRQQLESTLAQLEQADSPLFKDDPLEGCPALEDEEAPAGRGGGGAQADAAPMAVEEGAAEEGAAEEGAESAAPGPAGSAEGELAPMEEPELTTEVGSLLQDGS